MSDVPGMTPQKRSFFAAIVVTAVIAFTVGNLYARPARSDASSSSASIASATTTVLGVGGDVPADLSVPADFNQFWDLWRQLKSQYYLQPVDERKMLYGAMSGMAASLGDPYTMYFEPKSATEFSQSLAGKFEGIGAEIGMKDDQLQVIAPLLDTPADRAGLRAGDAILKINGQDTADMAVDKAVTLIRGKRGTAVSLLIARIVSQKDANGKVKKSVTTMEVTIIRDVIMIKSVQVKYLRDNVAQIVITSFNQDTDTAFHDAVTAALKKDVKGIVLDVRNDPGGYLDRAISVASEWLGDQVIVKERRQGKITEEYHGTDGARLKGIPTIVLVNQGSASASEIVAGALQDYGVAKLVGMKTFGKGSVQDYTEFSDHSAVKITIAEWLTPKDRSIHKIGITPDVTIDFTQDDFHANTDPQLDKALELLTGKPSPATSPAAGGKAAK